MNREIKFRAWDNENEYMISSKQGTYTALRNVMNIVRQDDDYYNNGDLLKPNKEKHTLMQYTGLHDKNGKEIYEGDIVKAFINGIWYIGQVIYEHSGFTIDVTNNKQLEFGRRGIIEIFTEVVRKYIRK